jgi:hypothetical protein
MTAAGNDGANVELIDIIQHHEGLLQLSQQVLAAGQVLFGRLAVDGNGAFAALQPDPGSGTFAPAQAVKI